MSETVWTKESVAASMLRTGYTFNTITLKSERLDSLKDFLRQKIMENPDIYAGTPVVLDVSLVKSPETLDFEVFKETLNDCGMSLIGLSGIVSENTAQKLQDLGIPVVNSNRYARIREENFKPKVVTKTVEVKVPYKIEVPIPVAVNNSEPMQIISRHIRSGELISVTDNSVMIIGNISPAARIIASHHILILGEVFGEIYAGSPKDSKDQGCTRADIFTFGTFAPSLVAIAGNYQTADDILGNEENKKFYRHKGAVMVSLQGKSLRYSLIENSLNNHFKK